MATVLLAIAGADARSPGDLALGFVVFAAVVVAVSWALPRVLAALRTQHDLFLIVSVAIGLAIAGVGAAVLHLPLALAAFIAGLAITESDAATEARQRLLPFRDLLAVLFFVAIGTLIDPTVLGRSLGWLGLLLALVIVAKSLVVYVLVRAARLPARPLQMAVGLSQVGEFSFVLAAAGRSLGVVGEDVYVAVLAAVAVSIGVSAVGVRLVGRGATAGPAGSAAESAATP
jgi:CPA2 family monovalent cation:H+ antiporter-2